MIPPVSRQTLLQWFLAFAVVGAFLWTAISDLTHWGPADLAVENYNRLVEGFRMGRLSFAQDAPEGLRQLRDPYDPVANGRFRTAPYSLHDISYYRGKLYLYFGVTPALILFWPWRVITDEALAEQLAVVLFCIVGFLAALGVAEAARRRYFFRFSPIGAVALVLGFANGVPIFLQRAGMWEVPIACGYAFTMVTLAAVWKALHQPERAARWLAVASASYGLAIGARPSLIFGGVTILIAAMFAVPRSMMAGRFPRTALCWGLFAALLPLCLVCAGLAGYNELRFGSPFEFGQHYQMAADRQDVPGHFSLRYASYNLWTYLLAPAKLTERRPFVEEVTPPAAPIGHAPNDHAFGLLSNIPFTWLVAAVPLLLLRSRDPERTPLYRFLGVLVGLSIFPLLPLVFFYGTCLRYEIDFAPQILLLAVFGAFAVDEALTDRPRLRTASRVVWGLLLGVSIGFNLCDALNRYAEERIEIGNAFHEFARLPEAIRQFELSLIVRPTDGVAQNNLGIALAQEHRLPEALRHFVAAVQLDPHSAANHFNLGQALFESGRKSEAAAEFRIVLRLDPRDPHAAEALRHATAAPRSGGRP